MRKIKIDTNIKGTGFWGQVFQWVRVSLSEIVSGRNLYPSVLIVLLIWTVLWINFMVRDLIKGGDFRDYKVLITRDANGKRSYAYGDYLFEFLSFCKDALPESAGYDIIGIEEFSLSQRRAIYYLYPHTKKEKADFLLVFNKPGFKKNGYVLYKRLDDSRFILKYI